MQKPSILIILFIFVTPITAINFGISDEFTRNIKVIFWILCTASLIIIIWKRIGIIQIPKSYLLWAFLFWLLFTAAISLSYYGLLLVLVLMAYVMLAANVYRVNIKYASTSMCRDMLIACSILTGINLLTSISPLAYAISDTGVRLAGIVGQPSQASQLAGVVIICSFFIRVNTIVRIILVVIAGAVMYMAGGRTILLSVCLALFAASCLKLRNARYIASILVGIGIVFPFVATEISQILQHNVSNMLWLARTGNARELYTLSGRIPLWSAIIGACQHNPFFGVGFGMAKSHLPQLYATSWGWNTDSAHNAYLHLIYETGVVGLTLMVTVIGVIIRKARLRMEWALLIFILAESVMSSTFSGPGLSPLALILLSMLVMSSISKNPDDLGPGGPTRIVR